MTAYTIKYPWVYNPHGHEGSHVFDENVMLDVRYHIQPDEPDVNVKFDLTIEEIHWNGVPLCTDAPHDSGWTTYEEDLLLEWLLDGNFENGKPVRALLHKEQRDG